MLLLLGGKVLGQEPMAEAPVKLDNEYIYSVRAGYGAWNAELRANSMDQRVKQWADDPLKPDKLTVQDNETTTDLMVGDSPLITILDIDAAAAGMSRRQLAQEWKAGLEAVVSRYRLRYAPARIALRTMLALMTIAVMGALLFFTRKGILLAEERFAARLAAHARRKKTSLTGLVADGAVESWSRSLFRWIRWFAYAAVILGGIQFLMLISPKTRADGLQILSAVGAALAQLGLKVWNQIPDLILVAVIAAIAYQLIRMVHALFRRVGSGQIVFQNFRPRWAATTDRLVSIFIVILAFLIAYPYIPGSSSPAFQGISIFLGALVSLGSTGLVGNALAGIMLTYIDGYQAGDSVQIGDTSGIVTRTALLTTQLRTHNQKLITVPNSIVMGAAAVNFSAARDKGTLIPLMLGVGYDAPWRQVEWLLLQAAARTQGLNRKIDPVVLITSLNQFDVTYELNAYLSDGEVLGKVRSQLARNVLDLFNENSVQIMTPAFESNPDHTVLAPRWNPPSPATTESAEGEPQPTAR